MLFQWLILMAIKPTLRATMLSDCQELTSSNWERGYASFHSVLSMRLRKDFVARRPRLAPLIVHNVKAKPIHAPCVVVDHRIDDLCGFGLQWNINYWSLWFRQPCEGSMYSQGQVGVERFGSQLLQPYLTNSTDRQELMPNSRDQSNDAHCIYWTFLANAC